MTTIRTALLSFSLLVVSALPARAATTTPCTAITSFPISITTAGVYCLTADATYDPGSTTATAAITVNVPLTNNKNAVVIDLAGYSLRCINGGTFCQATYGVRFTGGSGYVLQNGRITDFQIGAFVQSSNTIVRDIRFDAISVPDVTGVYADSQSYWTLIDNNVFYCATGRDVPGSNTYAVNLWYANGGTIISNNTIQRCFYGVKVSGSGYPMVTGNKFQSCGYTITGTGAQFRDNISSSCGGYPSGTTFVNWGNNSW